MTDTTARERRDTWRADRGIEPPNEERCARRPLPVTCPPVVLPDGEVRLGTINGRPALTRLRAEDPHTVLVTDEPTQQEKS